MKFILTALALILVSFITFAVLPDRQGDYISYPTPIIKKMDKYWFEADISRLGLIDNTKNQHKSVFEATASGCISGINAFYYDIENRPLGWLQLNNFEVNKVHNSQLLNGFVFVIDGKLQITSGKPEQAEWGHQGGPMLILNSQFLIPNNLDDKIRDRRSVAIQTEDDKAVFAYFDEASLAELPEMILNLGKENGFTVKNAINLDGGNSSAFWTGDTHVSETFFSGGFWCGKI